MLIPTPYCSHYPAHQARYPYGAFANGGGETNRPFGFPNARFALADDVISQANHQNFPNGANQSSMRLFYD